MKRSVIGGVIVLLVLLSLGIVFWMGREAPVAGAQIAPANSLFYAEFPHFQESATRFPDTALSQILNEPSVLRSLRQPISKMPSGFLKGWASFIRLRCNRVFLSSSPGLGPNWIVGFQTSVDRASVRREIESMAQNIFGRPLHELDLQKEPVHDSGLWVLQCKDWFLVGPRAATLKEAFQNGSTGSGGIQSDPLFRECFAAVPNPQDLLSFVRGGPRVDISSGFPFAFSKDARNGDIKAILCATRIDGALLRDTVFTCREIPPASTPFEQRGLDLSGPRTVAILTSRVGLSELWQITDQFSQFSQVAETIHDYLDQARSFGVDPRDLDNLVSAATIILDRDEQTDAVTACLSLRVIDPPRFTGLLEQIVARKFPNSFVPTQIGGSVAYVAKDNPKAAIAFGLVGREFLVATNASVLEEMLKRTENKGSTLRNSESFKEIVNLVAEPTDLFMYVDSKTAFARVYDSLRPMLVFGAAFVPTLGEFLDPSALPITSELSPHLTPIVLSRHRLPNGVLDESIGPVTAYQAFALGIGTTVAFGFLQRN